MTQLIWGRCLRSSTHNPPGLSEKDITMAKLCDELSTRPETLASDSSTNDAVLKATADTVSANASCCAPKDARNEEREKIEQEERASGAQGSVAGMGGQPS